MFTFIITIIEFIKTKKMVVIYCFINNQTTCNKLDYSCYPSYDKYNIILTGYYLVRRYM